NPLLNAVVTRLYDTAREQARSARGPFAGVPYLLKDLVVELAGAPFSEGSRYLRGVVSHVDSALVTRLRRAGLVIVGKTNTPEYGEVVAGWGIEHAVTRSVRDSAALLDATAGGEPGDPYGAPPVTRPYLEEVGADPGRLRIGYSPLTADGTPGHPDCLAALDD